MAGLDPAIHGLAAAGKTWMPATSAGMTARSEMPLDYKTSTDAPPPHLHGHAGFLGADAAGTGGARPRDRGRLYACAETRRPPRSDVAADAGRAGGAAAQDPRADAQDAEDDGGARNASRA